ncbi:MAG TPA: ABC transporter ATP-binding protein [Thermomonospora sp.]|nr:ABC transporter ATP-binding protein [Thermomonospora sp.]
MINRRLLAMAAPGRAWLGVSVAAGAAITACAIGQGLLAAHAVVRGLDGDTGAVVVAACAVAGLMVVRAVLVWAREVAAARGAERVKARLRIDLYRHLLTLGPAYVTRRRSGTVLAVLVDGVEALDRYVAVFLPQAAISLLGGVGVTVVLAVIDPVIALVVAVTAVPAVLAPRLVRRRLASGMAEFWTGWKGLGADYLDAVQGLPTLKAAGAVDRFGGRLRERSWRFYRSALRFTLVSTTSAGLVGFFAALGFAGAVGLAAWRHASGDLTVAEVFAVLLLSREAFRPVTDLVTAFHAGQAALPAAEGITELLAARPDVNDTGTRALPRTAGPPVIRFEDVSYTYPGQSRPAADHIAFEATAGTTTAIVGPSGAGKSTLIRLLLRFADPQRGRVTIDGTDLRDLPLATLRSLIAVVSQDVFLFHGTVADNIAFGRAGATREDVERAARAAHAHDFVTGLPDGYDTLIGERGLRLSGGQRQRLAIARALVADAPILVLDEATSSVDVAAERAITDALDEARTGRTVLVIAHRLSTVRDADRIVVLADGRVVEAATHDELVTAGGTYAQLVGRQREGAA